MSTEWEFWKGKFENDHLKSKRLEFILQNYHICFGMISFWKLLKMVMGRLETFVGKIRMIIRQTVATGPPNGVFDRQMRSHASST